METIEDILKTVMETADFRPLFDHFAEGVELKVTTSVGPSASHERSGRQSVIDYFRHVDEASMRRVDKGVDCFARGQRLVALRDDEVPIAEGSIVRSECAVVLDVRDDGKITSVAIHRELSPVVGAPDYADGSSPDKSFSTRPRVPMILA
jgi:ketosteroid isomerase-like protein